ncbi:sugar phosphate isomerase/epimerase family protein [Saliphagus infecundisoli]|uniref:Sugar phosphate isomerase/epimerase family protein n=1 Tax=Saliphagus infecundisoli TaxID=1849069 RepID=A0ABD5QFS2_9EURY|nr:TIM barrel protein [Saliphagus infecundisoli]
MDYGLCTISNKEWSIEDVLGLAANVGFDGVEVWGGNHVGNAGGPESPNMSICRTIADLAADLGLAVPVYGSYLRPGKNGFRENLTAELDAATALHANLVRVWPGDQEYGDHDTDHWDTVVTDLQLAGQRAADRDLAITVEKHEGTLTNRTEGARQLIQAVDSPAVGLNWQPLFFMDGEEILAEAETLAPLSNNVHLQATREQGGTTRCRLSEAYFDVSTVLEVFDDVGFEGYAEVEFVDQELPYEAAVRADATYLATVGP